jgi:hypothetical protein
MIISFVAYGQIEKHLNEKLDPICKKGSFLLGMALEDSVDFGFTLEDSERRAFNSSIAKRISSVTHKKYTVILPKELDVYRKCAENEFVLLKLVGYKEIEVGGYERTGTIEFEAMFFKRPDDADPYLKVRVIATGDSDYGHSSPMEDAIEEAAKELGHKLLKIQKSSPGFTCRN